LSCFRRTLGPAVILLRSHASSGRYVAAVGSRPLVGAPGMERELITHAAVSVSDPPPFPPGRRPFTSRLPKRAKVPTIRIWRRWGLLVLVSGAGWIGWPDRDVGVSVLCSSLLAGFLISIRIVARPDLSHASRRSRLSCEVSDYLPEGGCFFSFNLTERFGHQS